MTTDAEILEAFAEAGHEYLDMNDLVRTSETLADFKVSAKSWAECKEIYDSEYHGYAAIDFGGVQVMPGQPRHGLTVIDFGQVRYAYKI